MQGTLRLLNSESRAMASNALTGKQLAGNEPSLISVAGEILRIRLSQLIINEKYKSGSFRVPIHLALGHEAIAVAADIVLGKQDALILPHRNIHYNLARAKSLRPIVDEFLLKETGLANGKLGSMNLANPDARILYASSILGNNLGVAAGTALANKVSETGDVTWVVTGDGGMEEGAFYEALQFCAAHGLRLLILVENNEWSLATHIMERRCPVDLERIASAFGVPYARLEGNVPQAYAQKLGELRAGVMQHSMPAVVEVIVKTLGGWHVLDEGATAPRYINYHAGPAIKVQLGDWPVFEESEADPVYVLLTQHNRDRLEELSRTILGQLLSETR